MIPHKAKKSLGQNFLNSPKALSDILFAAGIAKNDCVLEIGPGKGVLTKALLEAGAKVIAVEKDESLAEMLGDLFLKEIKSGQLALVAGDILEFDLQRLPLEEYKLIANIPYYITGQIFRMFLESERQPVSMTMLVQKEVAERVVARDGKESILSLSVKAYGNPKYVSTVKRGSFSPAPNVDSAILHITDVSKVYFKKNKISERAFFEVLKASFAHKRKMIAGNLKVIFQDSAKVCEECGIKQNARAEDLELGHFACLAKSI